jgi:hypothetical protein
VGTAAFNANVLSKANSDKIFVQVASSFHKIRLMAAFCLLVTANTSGFSEAGMESVLPRQRVWWVRQFLKHSICV